MNRDTAITPEILASFQEDFNGEPHRRLLRNAIVKNGIQAVALNRDSLVRNQYTFSHHIETGKITSQKKSGRCWLFAGLNLLRQKVSQDLNIKDFELSQTHLMFWDKLEKANYFLENIIETVRESVDSRLLMWLLKDPVQDGGQWDMFSNLVKKYGVIPQYAMPETHHSKNSLIMNRLLTRKLRGDAATLRNMHQEGASGQELREKKKELLNQFFRMLVYFLDQPPVTFDFEYRDQEDKFFSHRQLTPVDFFQKFADIDLDDYISVINAPTVDKPFDKTYTVEYLGNVSEGSGVLYLNVDNRILKELSMAQLQDNEPIWFGCDVGKMMERESGVLAGDLYLYEQAMEISFGLDKAGRLDYGDSQLTHAMVFTGVNIVDGKPNRWKVENSWGDKVGEKGFFVMSDDWFDQYNFQVVIHKKYLPDPLRQALTEAPTVLPPWDPMGSLAIMK
jgi:bleomycin hydrolase